MLRTFFWLVEGYEESFCACCVAEYAARLLLSRPHARRSETRSPWNKRENQ